jgi:preprotein translocase subunit SecE
MARQTRAERRARRAERGGVNAGEAALPGGPPPPPPRPTARAEEQPQPERKHRLPGAQFISESWGELKKVEWPTQKQIIQATVVVLVACIIVGTYLWLADLVFKPLVEKVFL